MPTSLKTTQCNECLAVCINYAFCAVTLSLLLHILRIFVPKDPIDAIPKHLKFSSDFHAN